MKAYQLFDVGDLRYLDIDIPELRPGWCLVRVKACGICSSDIPRVFDKGTYHFPTIPGHEFSGVVEKVACEKDERLLGKRVGIFPLIPCKECNFCKSGQYELCVNYDYIGSRRDGAFAEYVSVPVWNLIELPDSVSFVDAAMLEPAAVALHAIRRTGLREGDKVVVVGSGMIGFAAGMWAMLLGAAEVAIVGRSEDKRYIAERAGLKYFKEESDDLRDVYDVAIEAVGSSSSIELSIKLAAAEGTIVLMGNPHSDIMLSQSVYWKILRKQLHLVGTWNSSYEHASESEWTEALNYVSSGAISFTPLVTDVFDQEDLTDALHIMRENSRPYCKMMTIWNEG